MDSNLARIASLIQALAAEIGQIHQDEIGHSAPPSDVGSHRDHHVVPDDGFDPSPRGGGLVELAVPPSREVQPAAPMDRTAIGEALEQALGDLAYRIESIDARLTSIEQFANDGRRDHVDHDRGDAASAGGQGGHFDVNGILAGIAHELDGIGVHLDDIDTKLNGLGALGETVSSMGNELHEIGVRLEQIERHAAEPVPVIEALMESTARFQLLDAKLDAPTFATEHLVQISERIDSLGNQFERLENEIRSLGRSEDTRDRSRPGHGDEGDIFGEAALPTDVHRAPRLEVLDDLPFDDGATDMSGDRWGIFRRGRASN